MEKGGKPQITYILKSAKEIKILTQFGERKKKNTLIFHYLMSLKPSRKEVLTNTIPQARLERVMPVCLLMSAVNGKV